MRAFAAKLMKPLSLIFAAVLVVSLIGSLFMQRTTRLQPWAVALILALYLICVRWVPTEELPGFYGFAIGTFFFAMLLNIGYELWHSRFYVHFTEPTYSYSKLVVMLLGAAVGDGFLALIHLFVVTTLRGGRWRWPWPWKVVLFVILWALAVQISIEIGALVLGSWAYNSRMPLIPVLQVGLTPAIQMPLLMLLTLWLAHRMLCVMPEPKGQLVSRHGDQA